MKKDYYPTINMLRGIAALMVCLFHFINYSGIHGELWPKDSLTNQVGQFGALGVFVFFVITGFVIPLSLFKSNFKLSRIHKFLSKRWLRIEIPYLASIVLVLVIGFLFSIKNHESFSIEPARLFHHVFYTAAFFDKEWYSPIFWTLAIEIQFYILLALVFTLLKFTNKYLNIIFPLFLAITPLFINDNRIVFHYGAIFSQGIILLLILREKTTLNIGVISILICAGLTWYVNGGDIAFAAIITVITIAFFNIDNKYFNKLGDVSYSLYLTHGLTGLNVIYLFSRYTANYFTKFGLVISASIFSIITAYIFWKLIEKPSKKLSSKIKI